MVICPSSREVSATVGATANPQSAVPVEVQFTGNAFRVSWERIPTNVSTPGVVQIRSPVCS